MLTTDQAAETIRLEYLEMPGLVLTFWQAQRLCELPHEVCDAALTALVRSRFLMQASDGRYRRRNDPVSVVAIEQVLHEAS